jgi:predicted nuclease of restriction endonuclease-like (RecB) superfamily
MSHIARFLIELGAGFAFVGRQVHLEVGGEDFYSTCSSIIFTSAVSTDRMISGQIRSGGSEH